MSMKIKDREIKEKMKIMPIKMNPKGRSSSKMRTDGCNDLFELRPFSIKYYKSRLLPILNKIINAHNSQPVIDTNLPHL